MLTSNLKNRSDRISLSWIWTSVHSTSRTRGSLRLLTARQKHEAEQQQQREALSANSFLRRDSGESKAIPPFSSGKASLGTDSHTQESEKGPGKLGRQAVACKSAVDLGIPPFGLMFSALE